MAHDAPTPRPPPAALSPNHHPRPTPLWTILSTIPLLHAPNAAIRQLITPRSASIRAINPPLFRIYEARRFPSPIRPRSNFSPGEPPTIVLRAPQPQSRYEPEPVRRPVEAPAPSQLRTPRLTLRALRDTDRFEFFRVLALSRAHLGPASGVFHDGEADEQIFERKLALVRASDADGSAWRRIGVLDDGRIAGGFNLNAIQRGLTFEADANWWLSADQLAKGLATEAVSAMIYHAFADLPAGLGLHRVNAAIMPGNTASIRLAARVGLIQAKGAKASIRLGDRWELHELYARSVLDPQPPAQS